MHAKDPTMVETFCDVCCWEVKYVCGSERAGASQSQRWHILQGPGCCGWVTCSWRFSTNIIIWLFVLDMVNLEARCAMCVDENVLYLFVSGHWWISINSFSGWFLRDWIYAQREFLFFNFYALPQWKLNRSPSKGRISSLFFRLKHYTNWTDTHHANFKTLYVLDQI